MKFLSIIYINYLYSPWRYLGAWPKELSQRAQQRAGAQINRCKSENSIEESIFEQIKKGKYDGSSNAPCFLQCALKGTQVLGADGEISEQSVMTFQGHLGGQQQAQQLYQKCKKYENGDTCENAKDIYDCFRSNNAGFL